MHGLFISHDDVLVLRTQSTTLPELEHSRVLDLALPFRSLLFD